VVVALNEMFGDGIARDAGAAVAAAVGAYLWIKMFDFFASKDMLERKLSRKLIHTSCGPFFMLTWPLFSSMPEARFFAAAVPLLQGIRLAAIGRVGTFHVVILPSNTNVMTPGSAPGSDTR
jgi:hypothetical protein